MAMSRSARIGGGGRSPVDYEASGDSEDKLSEVIDIHTDHDDDDDDDDDKDAEDEHDDAESSSGGGGGDREADEGVMWFDRRAVIGSTGKAENHRRAIGEDAAVATATAAAAAAAAAVEGEKGRKDAAKNELENELEDNRRFWEACLANEYTQFVDCANS